MYYFCIYRCTIYLHTHSKNMQTYRKEIQNKFKTVVPSGREERGRELRKIHTFIGGFNCTCFLLSLNQIWKNYEDINLVGSAWVMAILISDM